jgi:hypothetical protein
MEEIPGMVLNSLFGIITNIMASFKNDLFFLSQPRSLEEQIFSKVRGQGAMIQSQQEKLSYQAGVIQDHNRALRDRDDLLIQKDHENQHLVEIIRSLEFQLQEQTSRSKHWR